MMTKSTVRIESTDVLPDILGEVLITKLTELQHIYRWFTFDFLTGAVKEAVTKNNVYERAEEAYIHKP